MRYYKVRIGMVVKTITQWCQSHGFKETGVFDRIDKLGEYPHVALYKEMQKRGYFRNLTLKDFETVPTRTIEDVEYWPSEIKKIDTERKHYTWFVPTSSSAGYWQEGDLTQKDIYNIQDIARNITEVPKYARLSARDLERRLREVDEDALGRP